jgi:putative oligomerization/nucleic acid binding protein
VVLAILGLVLLFTAEVVDFTRLLVVVVLVALGAAWIELMRRQTLREFPDAHGAAFFEDTWERVTAWWDEQRAAAKAPKAASAPAPAPTASDIASRLTTLADLHAKGELTDEEYASAKARVLAED